MSLKLYERTDGAERTMFFPSKCARGRFLAQKKNEARTKRMQFTFKRNEYLRVYRNSVMFYELDITRTATNLKADAERLFKK